MRAAEVEGDDVDARAVVRAQLRSELLEAVETTRDEDEGGPAGGEPPGERDADAGAGTGDEGGLVGVVDMSHADTLRR